VKKVSLKREVVRKPAIVAHKDIKGTRIELPDLSSGRMSELKPVLAGVDRNLPLVLDLRNCTGGDLSEAALVAGLFGKEGTLVTIQEAGKPDRKIAVKKTDSAGFPNMAILQGLGTVGVAEVFSAFLKKQTVPLVGERTAGLGVERNRFPLKQGGALELVNRRWVGAGEEKLDRQGVLPDEPLKGLQVGEDPLPKVLEVLEARKKKAS
jgi:carboxyl-terminal processing protease